MFLIDTHTSKGRYFDRLDALPFADHANTSRPLRLLRAQTQNGVGTEISFHHNENFETVTILPQFFRQTRLVHQWGAGTDFIQGLDARSNLFPLAFKAGEITFHADQMNELLQSQAGKADKHRVTVFRVWHQYGILMYGNDRRVDRNIIFSTTSVEDLNKTVGSGYRGYISRPTSQVVAPYPIRG